MKTTHPKTLFFFACLFLLSTASAQHNFKQGYIVKTAGDTVQGFIDDGSTAQNSSICNFKSTATAEVTDFTPDQLKAYGFASNKHYVTKNIQPTGTPVYLFLECLVKGSISLYYSNHAGTDHYYIEQANTLYALTNEDVSFVDNGVTFTKKSNRYKGSLSYIMKDVPAILPSIQNTDLERASLIALVEKYYKNSAQPQAYITYHEKKEKVIREKIKLKFGVSLGANYSKMRFKSNISGTKNYVFSDDVLLNGSLSLEPKMMYSNMPGLRDAPVQHVSSMTIVPGLCLNISRNGKNSFQVEANFFRNNYKFREFTVQTNTLLVPLMYRRGFGYRKKTQPFINMGLCMGFNLNTQIDGLFFRYISPERNGKDYIYVTHEENITKENTSSSFLSVGLIAGLGFTYELTKKTALEFEFRTGLSRQGVSSNFDDHLSVYSRLRYWNNALSVAVSF